MTTLLEAACAAVERPINTPPDEGRRYFHVGGAHSPYGLDRLLKVAGQVEVEVFREREPNHPERGRFFMDATRPAPAELEPFLSTAAAGAAWDAGQAGAADKALLAGAASGLSGPLGPNPIAMPDPLKDPEGFQAVQRRFRMVGKGVLDAVKDANLQLMQRIPMAHAAPFRRTIDVLQTLEAQRARASSDRGR